MLALADIPRDIPEHPGPMIDSDDAGDSLRDTEMSGGQFVMEAADNRKPFVSWYAALPLFGFVCGSRDRGAGDGKRRFSG